MGRTGTGEDGNHTSDPAGAGADRRPAVVALQPLVGLLPERRSRPSAGHHPRFGADGTHLTSRQRVGEAAMRISNIECFAVAPRWLFVRVETDDGAVGWGEASLEGHAEAVDGAFAALRDRFVGEDPFRIEHIWQIGYRAGFYRGGPVLMSALAGLEQALWDLKGHALGLPAWQMMGGRVRDRIRAYAWIGGERPHEIADAARFRRSQGFTAVKMNATAEL